MAPLRDLVGAKGAGGETEMQNRGYKPAGGSQAGDSSFTYWREPMSNRCVAVRTTNGRYASITYTKDADCQGGTATQLPASWRQRRRAADGLRRRDRRQDLPLSLPAAHRGLRGTGLLPFDPDHARQRAQDHLGQEQRRSRCRPTGTNPQKTTSSFRDGQTRFDYGGNTYFVYRSPDRAQRELANFHD